MGIGSERFILGAQKNEELSAEAKNWISAYLATSSMPMWGHAQKLTCDFWPRFVRSATDDSHRGGEEEGIGLAAELLISGARGHRRLEQQFSRDEGRRSGRT